MTDGFNVFAAAEFGSFIAWWKLLPFLVIFFVWAKLLTWVDKDTTTARLPRTTVNGGLFSGFVLATILFFTLPGLLISLLAFLVVFGISVGAYLTIRSNKVGLSDLGEEIKNAFTLKNFGLGLFAGSGNSKEVQNTAGEVGLLAKSGQVVPPDVQDPARVGYDALQLILLEPLSKEAHTIEVLPKSGGGASKYYVDGVVYDGPAFEKQAITDALAFLKQTAGLDPEERRKKQVGKFKATFEGKKREVQVTLMGSSAGETATLEIDLAKRYELPIEQLGFTPEQLSELRAKRDEPGLILLAAPKGHGLTTLQYGLLRMHDAFVYRIMTLERDPPIDLESITQTRLTAGTPVADEQKQMAWLCSQEPDVILAAGIESGQSARDLSAFAQRHKAYFALRANDTFEALQQWVKLAGSSGLTAVTHVVAGRTFRRLCDATKVPYQPDERLLKQLGVPAGKVVELYKPNIGPLVDAKGNEVPDTFCYGLGYKGRIGVYEMLAVDDEIRQIMKTGANVALLRQAFRQQKRRYLQEMALTRVLSGETSVQEMLRVLKPEQTAQPAKPQPATK